MNTQVKHAARLGVAIILSTALLTACGGSGGSDILIGDDPGDGNNPGDDMGHEMTLLDGLSGDADNHDLLYFTQSAVDANSGLFSIDPAAPADTPVLVDAELGERLRPRTLDVGTLPPAIYGGIFDRVFFPIHEAEPDVTAGVFDNLRVASVFYGDNTIIDSLGYQRVSTSTASQYNEAEAVSGEDAGMALLNAMLQYGVEDAGETAILYQAGGWKQLRLSDDASTEPLELDDNFEPMAPIFDPATNAGAGYLVIDSLENDSLRFVDMSLTPVGDHVDADGGPLENILASGVVGSARIDGSVYVALHIDGDEMPTLWYYQSAPGGPGSISLVVNGSGAAFTFSSALLGGIATPAENHLVTMGDSIYFLHGELEEVDDPALDDTIFEGMEELKTKLIRLTGNSWALIDEPEGSGFLGIENAFLIGAGGRLVYEADDEVISVNTDGGDHIVLDTNSDLYGQNIDIGIPGSGNGWVFYNRTEGMMNDESFAVAARADGSQRLDLAGWRWLGASASATVGDSMNGPMAAIDVSEVFMINEDYELAAVSAAAPKDGMVNFGKLPNSASEVRMFGIAPGPHRLLQTTLEGEPDSYEVIYLDTRNKDSLQVISGQASTEDNQRPISRF
jgi:hypothetical protein